MPESWNNEINQTQKVAGQSVYFPKCTYKLFTRILTNRLTNKLDYYQVEQAAFRRHYSTSPDDETTDGNIALALIDFYRPFDYRNTG